MLARTAMLSERRVSTGLDALDDVLGGLYWGENVVWQLDRAPVEPFYRAIALLDDTFQSRTVVSLGAAVNTYGIPGLALLDAGSGPGELLRELRRRCRPRGRRLILFESLDSMARAWGAASAREFFARCCTVLLEAGAIGYWTMGAAPAPVQESVEAAAPCLLRVDRRSIRVAKAEGRPDAVCGSVLHWRVDGGRPVVEAPEIADRVAASLRALRGVHSLSQHDVGDLAGVTASAISQAERGERGLSLATLARLSAALGVTVDDLLHGEDRGAYRIGRRVDDPQDGLDGTQTLVENADLRIDLVRLAPRAAGAPPPSGTGRGIVAVAAGFVQVRVAAQAPVIRQGEVLVAESGQVAGWQNLGQAEALLFWICGGHD